MISILAANVFALTAKIGNARMVLRGETGEKVEKFVNVINDNDVAVDIEIDASGALADYVDIKDNKFRLGPGEEKKAYFTIYAVQAGSTETKINVKFTPDEGNGVGFSSTVIFIAEGEDVEIKNNNSIIEKAGEEIKLTTGKIIDSVNNKNYNLVIALALVMVLLFVLLIITSSRKKRYAIKSKKSGGK